MSQVTTQILEHEAKSAGDGVVHTFKLADGKSLKTWKQDIADQAIPFVGGDAVTIEYATEQKNKNGRVFTDSYINAVVVGGTATPAQSGQSAPAATVIQTLPDFDALAQAMGILTDAIQTLTDALLAQPEA